MRRLHRILLTVLMPWRARAIRRLVAEIRLLREK